MTYRSPQFTVMAIVLLAAAILLPLYWVAKGMGWL
jgi:hypothetical protein